MERNRRGFDEPRGTEINSDTLDPEAPPEMLELDADFSRDVDTDSIDVTEVTEDVYFPPADPPLAAGITNSREGLIAGFEPDSMASIDVDRSASGGIGDEALTDAIRRELSEDSATAGLKVHVRVEQGVVYLSGQVESLDDVDSAEEVAARVPGVQEVIENLQVR